jgi:hypothetical protein
MRAAHRGILNIFQKVCQLKTSIFKTLQFFIYITLSILLNGQLNKIFTVQSWLNQIETQKKKKPC